MKGHPAVVVAIADQPRIVGSAGWPASRMRHRRDLRAGTERRRHYFHARLPEQFDYVLHVDETRAVELLERTALWKVGEVAETFPSGL